MPGEYLKREYSAIHREKKELLYRSGSRLSVIEKPDQRDDESKAVYYWRVIRSCISTAVDVLNKVNAKDVNIRHGVLHQRHILHPHGVTHMIYNRTTKVRI